MCSPHMHTVIMNSYGHCVLCIDGVVGMLADLSFGHGCNGPFTITSFLGALNGKITWKRMLLCNLVA